MLNVLNVIRAVIVHHVGLDSLYLLTLVILVLITVINVLILLLVLNVKPDLKLNLVRVYALQDTV